MIGRDDAFFTYEYDDYFKILPGIYDWSECEKRIKNGVKVSEEFDYTSNNNTVWMSPQQLSDWIHANLEKIGII